jgi:Flp pilus assembly protein TadD
MKEKPINFSPQRLYMQSLRRAHAGDFVGAAEGFRRLLPVHRNKSEIAFLLGNALAKCGDEEGAEEQFRAALRSNPTNCAALNDLALLCRRTGRLRESHQLLDRALAAHPGRPEILAQKAELLTLEAEHDAALALLEPHLGTDKNLIVAHAYAAVLMSAGRGDLAAPRLRSLVTRQELGQALRISCHFFLGELHQQAGDYAAAFAAFSDAHRLEQSQFDATEFEQSVTYMLQNWTRAALQQAPKARNRDGDLVFIVGMPRSGTSLVEQMLASHPDVYGAGELPLVNRFVDELNRGFATTSITTLAAPDGITQEAVNRFAGRYRSAVRKRAGRASRITDKAPLNLRHLGFIALLFPGARVLWCRRDPMDTCLSCWTQKFYATGLAFTRNLHALGRVFRQTERIMQHWKSTLDIPIREVVYERMVESPESELRAILEFIGLPWSDACLRFHESDRVTLTASNAQVRKPVYRSSVKRHERYGDLLEPLRRALDLQ